MIVYTADAATWRARLPTRANAPVLVDGAKLADLMIEHEVGVTSRAVRVPKIDSDYFEE